MNNFGHWPSELVSSTTKSRFSLIKWLFSLRSLERSYAISKKSPYMHETKYKWKSTYLESIGPLKFIIIIHTQIVITIILVGSSYKIMSNVHFIHRWTFQKRTLYPLHFTYPFTIHTNHSCWSINHIYVLIIFIYLVQFPILSCNKLPQR